jgi:homocysteine S-methyltransferase
MRAATVLPIVVYPNAGGQWDPTGNAWHGAGDSSGAFPTAVVRSWLDAGVSAVGGCCGTDAGAINAIARQLAASGG